MVVDFYKLLAEGVFLVGNAVLAGGVDNYAEGTFVNLVGYVLVLGT